VTERPGPPPTPTSTSIQSTPSKEYRHADPVLILPPWEEIYTTDDERTMGFDLVGPFHEHLVAAYEAAGYDLVEVPKDRVEARVAFVRRVIEAAQPDISNRFTRRNS
jgi:predicted ATPase